MIDERNGVPITDASTVNLINSPSQVNLIDIVAAGGITDPTDIAGLQAWWVGDDVVGSDNDPIADWPDASGNGRDLASSGGARPTLQTAEVNGHDVLNFDGVSQTMQSSSQDLAATWGITNTFTAFFAIRTNSGPGTDRPLYYWSPGAGNEFGCWYQFTDNNAYVDCGDTSGGGRASGAVTSNTAWKVVVIVRNGAQVDIYEDGVNVLSVGGLTDGIDSGSAILSIASLASNFHDCDIEECGFYNVAISPGDRADLEDYLSARVM